MASRTCICVVNKAMSSSALEPGTYPGDWERTGYYRLSIRPAENFIWIGSYIPFPAYVSTSFASFKKRGIYVIEPKRMQNSCIRSILKPDQDRFHPDNWHPILTPLVEDVCTLVRHGLLFGYDSYHCALVEKRESDGSISYTARYFGFDFSAKRSPLPELKPITDRSELCKKTERVAGLLFENIPGEQFDYDTKHRHVRLSEEYPDLIPLLLETIPETVCKNSLQVVSPGSRDV